MNLPWPVRQQIESIGNEFEGMIQSGSQTVNELMENLGSVLPYALVVVMAALLTKYGIEEGMRQIKNLYLDKEI